MFNWIKNRKINKEIKKNLKELKEMLLNINIPEKASKKELDQFYEQIDLWTKVLAEKQFEFDAVMSKLSSADKVELLNHIDICINNYGTNMVNLNNALIECLESDIISQATKIQIVSFGKDNIAKSEMTMAALKDLAKHIVVSK